MNQKDALAAAEKHGSKAAAARELGVKVSTFKDWCAGRGGVRAAKRVAVPQNIEDRTAAFRQMFDKSFIIPEKVRAVVEGWLQRMDWATDAEMQKQCGVSNPATWKTYARENAKFAHLRFTAPGGIIIWAKSKKHRDYLLERAMA